MTPQKRQLLITIASLFGAGFVHSILPPWEMWQRAVATGASAAIIFLLLSLLLPKPLRP